jgi:hypothetical protein
VRKSNTLLNRLGFEGVQQIKKLGANEGNSNEPKFSQQWREMPHRLEPRHWLHPIETSEGPFTDRPGARIRG